MVRAVSRESFDELKNYLGVYQQQGQIYTPIAGESAGVPQRPSHGARGSGAERAEPPGGSE